MRKLCMHETSTNYIRVAVKPAFICSQAAWMNKVNAL